MYEVFYNFKTEPFRLSPDHKFCFEHKGYAKARAYMAYAFRRAEGFVMITGRPGTGKTTLIGELVESLSREKVFTANLVCTQLQADDLLKAVAYSFGVGSALVDKAELLQRLTILFYRWHREGRRALLIVDEAQDLSSSAMEELRLLTNIQIGGQPLLQIFLLGQPELRDLILSAAMEQVHQRIVAASHIEGLEVDETEAYVIHRLRVVGWQGDPAIDRAIFPLIHKFSEGVPRRINLICSRLFLLGSVEQRHAIEVRDVQVVISELQAENLAAGTGFSQDDFNVCKEPEWVSVPEIASQAQTEIQLHGVKSEPYIASDGKPSEAEVEPKKKDIPNVIKVSPPVSANDSISPKDPCVQPGIDPWDNQRSDNPAQIDVVESRTGRVVTDSGMSKLAQMPGTGNEARSAWKRAIVLGLLLVVVSYLIFFFNGYLAKRKDLSYPVPEPRVEMGNGQHPASAKSPSTSAIMPIEQLSQEVQTPSEAPANGIPDDVSGIAPVVAEPIDNHQAPHPDTDDTRASQSFQYAEPSDRNDAASTTLDSLDGGQSLPESTTTPEDLKQTFLVSFSFDSDNLLPDSHHILDMVIKKLRDQPDSLASITGFTDNQGDEYYNLMLSRKRADAVEQYLIDAGIDRQRLHVEGRGVRTTPIAVQFSGSGESKEPDRIVQIQLRSNFAQ